MEIPSYTSNIQPYTVEGGTNVAGNINGRNSGNVPNVVSSRDNAPIQAVREQALSVEAALEKAQAKQEFNREERQKMVEQMNEFISSINKGLSFRVDEESGRDVVTIYEAQTGDVIRQIPDEEMLTILRRLAAQSASSGLLVDKV
ncbi:flagellar protein FlaG [Vibrio sp. SM6]|uniref:Flagellar protein FlaG n=1 Tax=Vibrio agarilyticus TaxID=2726741 RepID=A0A7X8TR39_9VIBR|nr:flagellar protein FlaG [Vibrio agarilyticus]NLS13219.1 flagellar protein FlaG [Vibrio agarilyticus]